VCVSICVGAVFAIRNVFSETTEKSLNLSLDICSLRFSVLLHVCTPLNVPIVLLRHLCRDDDINVDWVCV